MGIVTRPFRPRPPIPFFVIPGPSVYDGPSQPVPTPTTGVLFSSTGKLKSRAINWPDDGGTYINGSGIGCTSCLVHTYRHHQISV